MVELRLDLLDLNKEQLTSLLKETTIPVIATCRSGKYNDSDRLRLLKRAVDSGAGCIDVELDSDNEYRSELIEYARNKGCKVIVSHHNMMGTPSIEELKRMLVTCRESGADIVKIVATAHNAYDSAVILSLYNDDESGSLIAFAMGEEGKLSRAVCLLMGAPFTYAAAEAGKEAAGGQLTVEELKSLIEMLKG